MTPLQDALLQFAQEKIVIHFYGEELEDLRRAESEADALIEELKALGGEAEETVKKLRFESDTAHLIQEKALFFAGVSVGLELGRL